MRDGLGSRSMIPDPFPIVPLSGPFRINVTPPGSKSQTNRALVLAALSATRTRPVVLRDPLNADDSRVLVRALRALGTPIEVSVSECAADGAGDVAGDGSPRGTVSAEVTPGSMHAVVEPDLPWKRIRVGGVAAGSATAAVAAARSQASDDLRLDLHNAGTATRFLAAAAPFVAARWSGDPVSGDRSSAGAAGPDAALGVWRTITIDGNDRMRERPVGELVELLRQLGSDAACVGERPDCPPVRISASPQPLLKFAGASRPRLRIPTTLSSQFISAVLQIGPLLPHGLGVELEGEITSPTYIQMTLGLMQRFGARFAVSGPEGRHIDIEPGGYEPPKEVIIEPDASSATYFLAAAAIMPHAVCTIDGLGRGSLQGDAAFADVLGQMGVGIAFGHDFILATGPGSGPPPAFAPCGDALEASAGPRFEAHARVPERSALRSLREVDMRGMPDAAMTLAVVAAFAVDGPTAICGLRTLAHKETDRLAALQTELRRIGCAVDLDREAGRLTVHPLADEMLNPRTAPPVEVETYDDHRMAMAFAIAGLRRPNIAIRNPGCVGKTWPGFWEQLGRLSRSPGQAGT